MYLVNLKKLNIKNILPNSIEAIQKQLLNILDFRLVDIAVDITHVNLQAQFLRKENDFIISPLPNTTNDVFLEAFFGEVDGEEVLDFRPSEEEEEFFYGAESLVADFENEIALCGVNEQVSEELFDEYCEELQLFPYSFELENKYKTADVSLFIGSAWLICLDLIGNKKIKKQILNAIKQSGKDIIAITKDQVSNGVLDAFYVREEGKLLFEKKAFELLTQQQHEKLNNTVKVEIIDFSLLHSYGIKIRDLIV